MNRDDFIAKLRQARALVASGWTQGLYRDGRCYCAMGALRRCGLWERDIRIENPGDPKLGDAGDLIRWNDGKARTQAEVVAMFDNSIAALERASDMGIPK